MSSLKIVKVTNNKEKDIFIELPFSIYKDNPYWVPPLNFDIKKQLDKTKNPFFKHADADFYLCFKDNTPVGRIAAIRNDLHNEVHNERIGFFGYFESINNFEVAKLLLDTAKDNLIEQGLDLMRGPASPSSNDVWGTLIEGFEDPPRMFMAYNPKYYIELFEKYGLVKVKDLYAFKITDEKMLKAEKVMRVSELSRKRYNMEIRNVDLKNLQKELDIIKNIYNSAWEPNWGFVPLTDEEIDDLAENLKLLVDKDIILFAEIEGKPVGFALAVPDYNFIFKEMNGKLLPFNFLKLFTKRKSIKWVRIIILGLIKEYQKKGLDAVLYKEIMERGIKKGYKYGEASWILEDNDMMIKGSYAMNAELYKKYRVYEKALK